MIKKYTIKMNRGGGAALAMLSDTPYSYPFSCCSAA